MPFTVGQFTGVGAEEIASCGVETDIAVEGYQVVVTGGGQHLPAPLGIGLYPHGDGGLCTRLTVEIHATHLHLAATEIGGIANHTLTLGGDAANQRRRHTVIERHLTYKLCVGRIETGIILGNRAIIEILHINGDALLVAVATTIGNLYGDLVFGSGIKVQCCPLGNPDLITLDNELPAGIIEQGVAKGFTGVRVYRIQGRDHRSSRCTLGHFSGAEGDVSGAFIHVSHVDGEDLAVGQTTRVSDLNGHFVVLCRFMIQLSTWGNLNLVTINDKHAGCIIGQGVGEAITGIDIGGR